jgi:anti-anti-sigma regulatory factor
MRDFPLERAGAKVKVVVGPELSAATAPALRDLLCAIQEDGVTDLALDFSQTTLLDGAGIDLLLAAHNSFFGGRKSLKLLAVPLNIFSLLQTLRLHERLGAEIG